MNGGQLMRQLRLTSGAISHLANGVENYRKITSFKTLRHVSSNESYLSFTMPYPLPGTALYERVKDRVRRESKMPVSLFSDHRLVFDSDFSEPKMKLGILKGQIHFRMQKRLGRRAAFLLRIFQTLTDWAFRLMK